MKNIIKFSVAIAAVVVALSGCQKVDDQVVPANNVKKVSFFARSIETKTAFGEKEGTSYPTLWTTNDEKVAVSLNRATAKEGVVAPSSDFKTATFDVEIDGDETGSYVFEVVSPSTACLGVSKTNGLNLNILATQTPTAASVDEAAQVLVAKSATYSTFPDDVELDFTHFTAYGKISILNLETGSAITAISLTADSKWAGRWYYNDGVVSENSASATIQINTNSAVDNWFACAPVDLGGKDIKVTVITDKGNYEKTITLPAGKKFESGKIAKFSVDFAGITPGSDVVYTKVTSNDQLTVDSELIIVAADASFAMSTTQNGNNRGQAAVVKEDNIIKNPSDAVQVFKAKKGSVSNTIAFCAGEDNYIFAPGGGNYLRTQESLDANASFSLSLSNGKSLLISQGDITQNILRYNSSSSLFSCYGATSSITGETCLYKRNDSGTSEQIFPIIPVTGVSVDPTAEVAVDGTKTLSATVAPANATNQAVTWESSNSNVATVSADGVVTGVAVGEADITVTTVDGSFTATCTVTVTDGDVEKVIYSTSFHYAISGSAYNSSTPISGKDDDGKEWSITYGNWNGSKQAEFRLYKSGGGYGVLEQKFDLAKVTKVVYKAKAAITSGAKLLLDTFYSTNGGTSWTQVDTAKEIGSSETEYSFTISATGAYSNVRIKFALSTSSTKPSSGNAAMDITSCEIYGL